MGSALSYLIKPFRSAPEAPPPYTEVHSAKAAVAVPHTLRNTVGNEIDAEIKQRLDDLKQKGSSGKYFIIRLY